MELFRYTRSVYGQEQLVGASWDLLPWFVGAGIAFIIVHAIVAALSRARDRGHRAD
jgi:hypothetical protein